MPTYCRVCVSPACGHKFSTYRPVAEVHLIRCEKCGGEVDIDMQAQGPPIVHSDELHGPKQTCHEVSMQPHEVAEARRLFGAAGSAIQDDGSVKFRDKTEARNYFKAEVALKRQFAEQRAEGKMGPTKREKRDAARAKRLARKAKNA